jgi:AbiV family abortive infection protein
MDAEQIGVSLSLSVLAMEEVGKMMYLDGLLFARPGDYKHQKFKDGFRKHAWKLSSLDLFPFFLNTLATADPRYGEEAPYNSAIAITLENLKMERLALIPWLGESCELTELDKWKQRGFYASPEGSRFGLPNEVISKEFAKAVHTLASRFTSTLDFLLKNGNIDRYFARARVLRSKLSETDHQFLERLGRQIADEIFENAGEENESQK